MYRTPPSLCQIFKILEISVIWETFFPGTCIIYFICSVPAHCFFNSLFSLYFITCNPSFVQGGFLYLSVPKSKHAHLVVLISYLCLRHLLVIYSSMSCSGTVQRVQYIEDVCCICSTYRECIHPLKYMSGVVMQRYQMCWGLCGYRGIGEVSMVSAGRPFRF